MARNGPGARVERYYRRVADSLIDQIERGTAPWTQAWRPGEKPLPSNIKTGKRYRGGNLVWLTSTADRRGYRDERWGTYRQVQSVGGYVRRGQKGCPILFWQFEKRKLKRDDRDQPVLDKKGRPVYVTKALSKPWVYQYTVFNAEQCAGLPKRVDRSRPPTWNSHQLADQVLKRSGAEIEHTADDRAFYDLRRDRIVLPFRDQFPSAATYYQSALHELGHWTGHRDRLNRQTLIRGLGRGFASRDYAREELRAEISSMITGDHLDLGHDPKRHAAYVGTWVQQLSEDPREIYRACKDAQDMSDFVLERARLRDRGGRDVAGQEVTVQEPPSRPANPDRTSPLPDLSRFPGAVPVHRGPAPPTRTLAREWDGGPER